MWLTTAGSAPAIIIKLHTHDINDAEEKGFCLAHFINDGVQLSGNTATFEFTGVGDFETFNCNLDREGFKSCKNHDK